MILRPSKAKTVPEMTLQQSASRSNSRQFSYSSWGSDHKALFQKPSNLPGRDNLWRVPWQSNATKVEKPNHRGGSEKQGAWMVRSVTQTSNKLRWYPQQPQRFIFTNLSEACCKAKRPSAGNPVKPVKPDLAQRFPKPSPEPRWTWPANQCTLELFWAEETR